MVSLKGPVEQVGSDLVLLIPLEAGGQELHESARGIGKIEGDFLKIIVPNWLAAKMGIRAGSVVVVDNEGGKLNLTLSQE